MVAGVTDRVKVARLRLDGGGRARLDHGSCPLSAGRSRHEYGNGEPSSHDDYAALIVKVMVAGVTKIEKVEPAWGWAAAAGLGRITGRARCPAAAAAMNTAMGNHPAMTVTLR